MICSLAGPGDGIANGATGAGGSGGRVPVPGHGQPRPTGAVDQRQPGQSGHGRVGLGQVGSVS